jgi:peptidoglycan hydrolase CwlO-like protein
MKVQISGIWLLIFVAIVAIAGTLFLRGCFKDKADVPVVTDKQIDSLHKANIEAQNASVSLRQKIIEDSLVAQKKIDDAHVALMKTNKIISQLEVQGKRLREQLGYYAAITDTGMIDVHPAYVTYCDSIAEANEKWPAVVDQQKKEFNTVIDGLQEQLGVKNREVAAKQSSINELSGQNAWLTKGISEIANKSKPRNKIFFGPSIAGTQENWIYGAGVGAALLNKKDQLLEVDALLIKGGQIMYRVGGKFKISFR